MANSDFSLQVWDCDGKPDTEKLKKWMFDSYGVKLDCKIADIEERHVLSLIEAMRPIVPTETTNSPFGYRGPYTIDVCRLLERGKGYESWETFDTVG